MLKVEVTTDWRGRPMEELTKLIQKRVRTLHENARDAVVATAIDVVRSLRALTRKAPKKANDKSFTVEKTPYVASWVRVGKSFRRVARVSGTGSRAPIYPVNHAGPHYVKGEQVFVYRITPKHGERWTWEKNRNKGCWYVFAQSESVARRLGNRLMTRVLEKDSGLAKTALGFAMAHLSTKSVPIVVKDSKARKIAAASWRVVERNLPGGYGLTVEDNLDYAADALDGGQSAISLAMMKAANKIAGRIAQFEKAHFFDERTATPFPEIRQRRSR